MGSPKAKHLKHAKHSRVPGDHAECRQLLFLHGRALLEALYERIVGSGRAAVQGQYRR